MNSLLIALMPTASTSSILGNNECFEPITSNICLRRVLSGEFVMINQHLRNDLEQLGLWRPEIYEQIIRDEGSIQDIEAIPADLKKIYLTAYEIPLKDQIVMAAERAMFIDQSQSLNIKMNDGKEIGNRLHSLHLFGWRQGLKTGSYYISVKQTRKAIKYGIKSEGELCQNKEGCLVCSS